MVVTIVITPSGSCVRHRGGFPGSPSVALEESLYGEGACMLGPTVACCTASPAGRCAALS